MQVAYETTSNLLYANYINSLVWRGAKETATFYRFWRVRLALHVTAKGIYILGFCISTFIHSYIHIHLSINLIHSCILVITLYYLYTCNRLLLHLIIVYLLFAYTIYCFMFIYAFASCSIAWFPSIVPVGFLLAEVRPPTLV
jgi:hypothetical protein